MNVERVDAGLVPRTEVAPLDRPERPPRRAGGFSASNIGRTAMPDYRAYIMGPDGHVQNRVELRCDDDVEVVRLAKQVVDGHDVELWQSRH